LGRAHQQRARQSDRSDNRPNVASRGSLLGIILLLPLLKLPEAWTWVTQKGVGILFIAALSFLIVRGINAVQSALLSRHRLGRPR